MDSIRLASRLAFAGALALLAASDALAVRRTEDALALVPSGAATVGVIRWNELRSSPLGPKVFAAMDEISADGDAARFLEETGLTPREDIDTVIVAMSPGAKTGDPDDGLVVFEGRFDANKIASALTSRGAKSKTAPSGDVYYRLANKGSGSEGAVALVNRGLVVAGSEPAVLAALARKENGGSGGLTSGEGLGKHLSRVDTNASAWALVDLNRFPRLGSNEDGGEGEPSRAIVGAMKSVTLLALQAKVRGDAVDLAATGLTPDAEKRDLLEDSLRGVLAMWRLAVQEKSPELVSVIRRFQIDSDADSVSIHGSLPATFLRSLGAPRQASH
ncbi:MAG: hypothetical protein WAU32_05295 [Thermoanaerobaculia bacterium]